MSKRPPEIPPIPAPEKDLDEEQRPGPDREDTACERS